MWLFWAAGQATGKGRGGGQALRVQEALSAGNTVALQAVATCPGTAGPDLPAKMAGCQVPCLRANLPRHLGSFLPAR